MRLFSVNWCNFSRVARASWDSTRRLVKSSIFISVFVEKKRRIDSSIRVGHRDAVMARRLNIQQYFYKTAKPRKANPEQNSGKLE
jgi:hypothetical protein